MWRIINININMLMRNAVFMLGGKGSHRLVESRNEEKKKRGQQTHRLALVEVITEIWALAQIKRIRN